MVQLRRVVSSRLFKKLSGFFLLGITAIALLAGTVQSGRFLWTLLAHLDGGFAAPLLSWLRDYVWTRPDGWLTGIATVLLFWATLGLVELTRRQAVGDAPLLLYTLSAGANDAPSSLSYDRSWEAADENVPELAPYLAGSASYIDIRIDNQQPKPYGLAIGLVVTIELRWGGQEGIGYHPFRIERQLVAAALGAHEYTEGRIFNVGRMPCYVAQVVDVTYADMSKRIRHAAYGTGTICKRLKVLAPTASDTVFMPTKGELR